MLQKRILVASKKIPADIVIKNGTIINVFSNELMHGDIAIVDGYIAGIGGSYYGHQMIDAEGMYVAPGLIDGHVHIESAMVTPVEFAKTVLPHGITAAITDPHEIANVSGTTGIQFILESSEHIPFDTYVMLPSSVPSTKYETSGASLEMEDLQFLLENPRVLGLAEVMNFSSLKNADRKLLTKITTTLKHKGIIDGHGAGLDAEAINIYTAAMIRSDHESVTAAEAKERLERGMYVMIRQGTLAKDLDAIIHLVNERNARRFIFVTDDKHLDDLHREGSVDYNIRLAIQSGIQPITAIQMATINTAEYFGLYDQGAIAPGYKADIVFLSDLESFAVEHVFKNGVQVVRNTKLLQEPFIHGEAYVHQLLAEQKYNNIFESVHIHPIHKADLAIPLTDQGPVNIIGVIPNSLITEHLVEQVATDNGEFSPLPHKDLLKLAVIERHHLTRNIGLGIVKGFGLHSGAIASTIGHDSHNLLVLGTNDEDMIVAIDRIRELQGGLVVVENGNILGELPLSIAGIISIHSCDEVLSQLQTLTNALKTIGASTQFNPFLMLSFLALPVIPHLKLTDYGLFNVDDFAVINIEAKREEYE